MSKSPIVLMTGKMMGRYMPVPSTHASPHRAATRAALAAALVAASPASAARAEPPPAAPAPASAPAPVSAPATPLAPPPLPPAPPDTVRPTIMLVTSGLAVVGLGLGGVFGGLAISKWDETQDAAKLGCQDPANYQGCTKAVGDLQVEASSFATISTFCVMAGSVAFAGTILLWVTGPRDGPPGFARVQLAPVLGPGATGGLVKGVF